MKVAFITHYCTHYRVKTYETLARYYDVDYYFYSQGNEWYWLDEHGVRKGEFHHEYLPGFTVGRTRVTPTLPLKLLNTDYDVYIKCINGKFVLPLTYAIARLRRKPLVLWTGVWMRLQTPVHRLFFRFTRYFYHHADAIVTYGEHVRRYLLNEGASDERVFVTRHAVDNGMYNVSVSDEEKTKLRDELRIASDQRIVLYLGRLVPEKGLEYLIDAFANLDREGVVLVIAGTGPELDSLRTLACRKGVTDRLRFVGYVRPEETVRYYAAAYVYVLPSVTTRLFKEPWGLVVNEAFNQGVPVIVTEAVGAAAGGLVQDGVNGFIVPERNSQAIRDSMRSILDDPVLRMRLSQNARRLIATWDNEQMVAGFRAAVDYVRHAR